MKIVINAIRLNSAGGLRVGTNLLIGFNKLNTSETEIIFLCSKKEYLNQASDKVKKVFIPEHLLFTRNWLRAQRWVRSTIKSEKPDILFNLCNTPLKTETKQLLLIHWSYAVFDEDYIWKQMPLKDYISRKLRRFLIRRNYKYIDHLTVQTSTMKERASNSLSHHKEISVIPSSFDLAIEEETIIIKEAPKRGFLYLSRYYYHKNHQILIEVAKLIKKRQLNFEIQITIDESKSDTRNFLKQISKNKLEDQIRNLGSIAVENVDKVFEDAYASLNPSFLESFGLTYLEAASKGKLVLASNLDFVRETMKEAAIYFDPFNAESILHAMIQSTDKDIYKMKVKKGLEIVRDWPSWDDITQSYYLLLKEIVASN